jgi:hypothetical protein
MFTKAEVAKMSVEQQEILAQIELSKTRRRQKLLELARGLDWRSRFGRYTFLQSSWLSAHFITSTFFMFKKNPLFFIFSPA